MIGDDGNVYEGRGFSFEGEHTSNLNGSSYNNIGIGVAFIGTFTATEISPIQQKVFEEFLKFFIEDGSIRSDYLLFFHDQISGPKHLPADKLFEAVKTWKNFYSGSLTKLEY